MDLKKKKIFTLIGILFALEACSEVAIPRQDAEKLYQSSVSCIAYMAAIEKFSEKSGAKNERIRGLTNGASGTALVTAKLLNKTDKEFDSDVARASESDLVKNSLGQRMVASRATEMDKLCEDNITLRASQEK